MPRLRGESRRKWQQGEGIWMRYAWWCGGKNDKMDLFALMKFSMDMTAESGETR